MQRMALSIAFASFLLVACGPPVTVRTVDPRDVYASDAASALDSGLPTRFTKVELHRTAISAEEDPQQRLKKMRAEALRSGRAESILATAELSFLEGQRTSQRSYYLAATVYAYLYLFGTRGDVHTSVWDPRSRIAADIYNRALARAFSSADGKAFLPAPGLRRLPFGKIRIEVPHEKLTWDRGVEFTSFLPADVFEVTGLEARYRQPGLGAPLIAVRSEHGERLGLFPERLEIPATAFLRVNGDLEDLQKNHLEGVLELYDPRLTPEVEVAGQAVPLEAQTTTAYAHLLGESPLWQFELAGFLSGDEDSIPSGIRLLEEYRADAIPIILVHGTASSAARWAGLVNDLNNDPRIHKNFQFWFFTYNSGNPISYSAARLREAITETVETLDPDRKDLAANEIILIGHSQGGLLVRLAISDSTGLDWKELGVPVPDLLELDEESRQGITEVLEFKPTPGVTRAIFIATPHRGSFMAGGWVGSLGASLVSVSENVLKIPLATLTVPIRMATGQPQQEVLMVPQSAVSGMAPNSRFVELLQEVPMSPSVKKNSIIAVRGDGPIEKGTDGVVAYRSAHIEEAESELVVPSGHSVQSDPRAVAEVQRILIQHLSELGKPSASQGPPR